jgi:diacylglycerol kinase family enzyme
MKIAVVLNREGGTLRTLDLAKFEQSLAKTFEDQGHDVKVAAVAGEDLVETLEKSLGDAGIESIVVGGGDGTVSTAAGMLMGTKKALGVLPAGTMNLFARSLGIPQDLDQAVEALAGAPVKPVDIATANDRTFVHQYSVGMHAKLVHLRDRMEYGSRLGKIRASARASYDALFHPPRLRVKLKVDGKEISATTASIGITNNLFGEGHLPYTDEPDGGRLGVYLTRARTRREMIGFAANMLMGRWKNNAHVEILSGRKVDMTVLSGGKRFGCAVDGELHPLEERVKVEIHPGALLALVPAP